MIGLEEALKLRLVSEDVYEAVTQPWSWFWSNVVPGSALMGLTAAAAYETVPEEFAIDTFQAYFLTAPKTDGGFRMRVQRLNEGGRFRTRTVTLEQDGAPAVLATCTFVRPSTLGKRSMQHVVKRATTGELSAITLDDLEPGRGHLGPYMKFQRLPLVYTGPPPEPENPPPESITYTSAAQIAPRITSDSRKFQALGIIVLSDHHVADCAPTVHGITVGMPAINDYSRKWTEMEFDIATSLNHTIHFHALDGFRADDLCYVEANTPWANARRAEVQTRIFDAQGGLIATCLQESYYVFKSKKGSKI